MSYEVSHDVGLQVPMPACNFCNVEACRGEYLSLDFADCIANCSGHNTPVGCPAGLTQFPEPLPGISGWPGRFANDHLTDGRNVINDNQSDYFPFSVVDKVVLPKDLEAGDYLLSWRWDCEQSAQIWLNCADVILI